jgi:hypothetical protein
MSHSPVRNQISAADPAALTAYVGKFQAGDTAYVASPSAEFIFSATNPYPAGALNLAYVLASGGGFWLRNMPNAATFLCDAILPASLAVPALTYLTPGYGATTVDPLPSSVSLFGVMQATKRTVTSLRVSHDSTAAEVPTIQYTITLNGAPIVTTALSLDAGMDAGEIYFGPLPVVPGDVIGVTALPTGVVVNTPRSIVATVN